MKEEIMENITSQMMKELTSQTLMECQNKQSFDEAAGIVNLDLMNDVVGTLAKLVANEQIEFVTT